MAKKAVKNQLANEPTMAGGAAPKKAPVSRTKKHIKAQASGVVAAVEGFVSAITHTELPKPAVAVPEIDVISDAAAVPQPKPVAEPTREQIAKLAFCYYMDRNGQNGSEADDWLRAEQTLRAK